ncbi:MAG: hypothetical protein LBF88_08695 [Planctomycetaceae bacterium]|jgi:hypothetical protein|nr:hypothetical protein [Planctomycetaceae bacterium]
MFQKVGEALPTSGLSPTSELLNKSFWVSNFDNNISAIFWNGNFNGSGFEAASFFGNRVKH